MLSRWDPFAEIAWRPTGDEPSRPWFTPAVDIFEDHESVVVRVELPGVRPEDVHIDAGEHVLTVRGERRLENSDRREGYHRLERSYGAFSRSFQLPENVDGPNAAAVMNDGVLSIRIPKRGAADSTSDPLRRAS